MPVVRFAKPDEGRSMIEVRWNGEAVQVWNESKQKDKRRKRSAIVEIRQSTHLAECLHVRIGQCTQVEASIDSLGTVDKVS